MGPRDTLGAPRRRVRARTFDWARVARLLLVIVAAAMLAAAIVGLTRVGREGAPRTAAPSQGHDVGPGTRTLTRTRTPEDRS